MLRQSLSFSHSGIATLTVAIFEESGVPIELQPFLNQEQTCLPTARN
jgi:hypothetical protein